MSSERRELFLLCEELSGHDKGIRSLCVLNDENNNEILVTGGYDGLVVIWNQRKTEFEQDGSVSESSSSSSSTAALSASSRRHSADVIFAEHAGVVTCVCEGTRDVNNIPTFFSGGQDKKIFWVNIKGTKLQTITGHAGMVNSLTLTKIKEKTVLLSGSWDATAKIWDIQTGECLHTLSGHSYAVSVFSWRCPNRSCDLVITGSQDGILHFWDYTENQFGTPAKSVSGYHTDIIRGFSCLNPTSSNPTTPSPSSSILLSCSNDGTFKAASLICDKFNSELVTTVPIGDTFIFAILAVPLHSDIAAFQDPLTYESLIFAGCENGSLKVVDLSTFQIIQEIDHKSTVWKVSLLSNGDLLTACADGFLRIWTKEEARALPIGDREKQKQAATQLPPTEHQESSLNIASLPDVSKLSVIKGQKAGQHKLFRDGQDAVVYIWNGHAWELIGTALGPKPGSIMGKFYKGDDYFPPGEYDYIFDAEIADDGKQRPIPFRVGDNTLLVAEKFCAREGISKLHVPQIEEFIKKNTVVGPKHPSRSTATAPAPTNASVPTSLPPSVKSKHFPPLDFIKFKSYNADKLKEKLLEFNAALVDEKLKFSELEKSYLDALIHKLKQAHLANEHLRLCEVDLVFNSHLTNWPPSKLFAVIDLWRIVVLHDQSTGLFKKSDGGWSYISFVLKSSKLELPDHPQLALCCMRYLCNMFEHPTTTSSIIQYDQSILELLSGFPVIPATRQTRVAEASFFVNLCTALGQSKHSISVKTAENILSSIIRRIQIETDEAVRYSLLVAAGTLVVSLPPAVRGAVDELCQMLNLQLKDENIEADELKSIQRDVSAVLVRS